MKTKIVTQLVWCSYILFLASGCGSQKYEERLQNTVKYYQYLDVQNKNLAPAWALPNDAISYRVPKQFEVIPAPKPDDYNEEGELRPGKTDLRQPTKFIPGMTFNGLQSAWSVQIPIKQQNNSTNEKQTSIPGYLYLLSNRDYFMDDDLAETAPEFTDKTLNDLANMLSASLPERDTWDEVKVPEKPVYSKQKNLQMLSLKSNKDVLSQGIPTGVRIYIYETGEIQTLLVFILPLAIEEEKKDDGNKLLERIKMSLETLIASDKPPKPNLPGGGDPTGGF